MFNLCSLDVTFSISPPVAKLAAMRTPFARLSIFQPISEASKTDLIADRLSEAITSGLLKNGERLPGEPEMSRLFSVAPTTTREALDRLRRQGLITTRRGRDGGSFVISDTERNIRLLSESLERMPTIEIKNHRALYIALISSSARIMSEEASPRERRAVLDAIDSLVHSLDGLRHTTGSDQTRSSHDDELVCFTLGRQEAQIHAEIAAATQSPHMVDELVRVQGNLRHLLWLRFADSDTIRFLRDQYSFAAHLLRTHQDQLFTRRITDIVIVGFSWLIHRQHELRRMTLASALGENPSLHPREALTVAHDIGDFIDGYLHLLSDWEDQLHKRSGEGIPDRQVLASLMHDLVVDLINDNENVLGAGMVPTPDFLSDMPWQSFWWTVKDQGAQGASISPLQISSDPQSSSFYDVTSQEWWASPRTSGHAYLTGPYIDYICSNEYTLTLSAPFELDHRFAGILGIDLSVSRTESTIESLLWHLNRAAVLVGDSSRVIASTNDHLLCGDLVDDHASPHPTAVVNCVPSSVDKPSPLPTAGSLRLLLF